MKKRLIAYSLMICLGWVGCRPEREIAARDFSFLTDSVLREGDLIFRRGQAIASRAVLIVDHHSVYSHAGIAVRDSGRWKVVHVVPGEPEFEGDPGRIKMEELSLFFMPQRAVKGAVMRVNGDPEMGPAAARRAVGLFREGILFDHDYDLADTTRMYCSEMIHKIFLREGIDLTDGKRSRVNIPLFKGEYILPGDLQNSPYVKQICEF